MSLLLDDATSEQVIFHTLDSWALEAALSIESLKGRVRVNSALSGFFEGMGWSMRLPCKALPLPS